MLDITLLADYRGAFYSSTRNATTLCSLNVDALAARFREAGVSARVMAFPDVDFREPWEGRVVLYQSSEDTALEYKGYIEDVVLALSSAGAMVVPRFEYLRAHHNKVAMEFVRAIKGVDREYPLRSRAFGTLEDFLARDTQYPAVLKSAAGAGSSGVHLVWTKGEAIKKARALSRSALSIASTKELVKRVVRRGYVPYSMHRRKFISQEFVSGLDHDYKVLIYGSHVFVVRREVRSNDFRASGSGRVSWPRELPAALLDFAWTAFERLDVPFVSMDIAHDGCGYRLIEFQCVSFGPLALERSECHWLKQDGGWLRVDGAVELERTFAASIASYVRRSSVQRAPNACDRHDLGRRLGRGQ